MYLLSFLKKSDAKIKINIYMYVVSDFFEKMINKLFEITPKNILHFRWCTNNIFANSTILKNNIYRVH